MANDEKKNKVMEELEQRSVEQQFANDAHVLKTYMDREQPTEASQILRRSMLMLEQAKLHYRNEEQTEFLSVSATNQNLPEDKPKFTEAAILSHGGRIKLQFPPQQAGEDKNAPLNWLLKGDANDTTKIPKDRNSALAAGKTCYQRSFASHSVNPEGEKLLKTKNPADWPQFASDKLKKRHYGVDLGLDGAEGVENGANGHLYVYWNPETRQMLLSIEGSAPGVTSRFGNHHGAAAKSSDVTATGGLKYRHQQFNDYPIRPAREDGMRAEPFTTDEMNTLYQKQAEDFSTRNLNRPVNPTANNTLEIFRGLDRGRAGERPQITPSFEAEEDFTSTTTTRQSRTPVTLGEEQAKTAEAEQIERPRLGK